MICSPSRFSISGAMLCANTPSKSVPATTVGISRSSLTRTASGSSSLAPACAHGSHAQGEEAQAAVGQTMAGPTRALAPRSPYSAMVDRFLPGSASDGKHATVERARAADQGHLAEPRRQIRSAAGRGSRRRASVGRDLRQCSPGTEDDEHGLEEDTYTRGNGEQATAAVRANTIIRRAATPAPAMSPAKCRNSGCETTA